MKKLKYWTLLLIILLLCGCSLKTSIEDFDFLGLKKKTDEVILNSDLNIHFIDVGQGDAIFIELPNDETMLIDAGESENAQKVYDYIKDLGYDKINYVVGTHPHSDHIGALAYQITNFEVDNIYLPKVSNNTKTYENLLKAIKKKNKSIVAAQKDIKIINSDDLKVYFLAPFNIDEDNLNNNSAVIKIEFKDKSFLFMGDAEEKVENKLKNVQADVIKVGHHGSNTSSSKSFVEKVKATYAVVCVGEANQYDLPSSKIIKRWQEAGAQIYRTDKNGNIVISSNGEDLKVRSEKD